MLRLLLDADARRADDLDVDPLEEMIEPELNELQRWSAMQMEPDIGRRETMAMILGARVILMEMHTWPLMELEDQEV